MRSTWKTLSTSWSCRGQTALSSLLDHGCILADRCPVLAFERSELWTEDGLKAETHTHTHTEDNVVKPCAGCSPPWELLSSVMERDSTDSSNLITRVLIGRRFPAEDANICWEHHKIRHQKQTTNPDDYRIPSAVFLTFLRLTADSLWGKRQLVKSSWLFSAGANKICENTLFLYSKSSFR